MLYKKLLVVALIFATSAVYAAPAQLAGKRYDMTGEIDVKASARCGAYGGSASAKSPIDDSLITTTIEFPDSDLVGGTFNWSNDSLMPPGSTATGQIVERNGNSLVLQFAGKDTNSAGTALFQLAQIPPTTTNGASVNVGDYTLTANAAKDKIKVREKVTVTATVSTGGFTCNYKWTVRRTLKGLATPPPI